jgi:hypothetical protein
MRIAWAFVDTGSRLDEQNPRKTDLKTLVGYALLLVLGGATQSAFADGSRQETIRKILPTVVQIVIEQDGTPVRTGSGVIIGPPAFGVQHRLLCADSQSRRHRSA